METFRELYLEGSAENLAHFISVIKDEKFENWKFVSSNERKKDYLMFDYLGDDLGHARLYIYLGDLHKKDKLQVGNIVPIEKSKLNTDEYNAILMNFYLIVVSPYMHRFSIEIKSN